jgi:DNA processing protein
VYRPAIGCRRFAGGFVTGPPGDAEIVAACAFASLPGVGAATLSRIAKTFGSYDAALRAGTSGLHSHAAAIRLRPETLGYLEDEPDLARLGAWALEEARKAGARPLLLGHEGYPLLLSRSAKAPAILYVRGTLAAEARRVAVVGARECDERGLQMARSLGEDLARAQVEVVSGGARGVDAAAHAGALWGGGTTVAVLGCGIDQAYPAENRELFERIAAGGGALASELVPGSLPKPAHFPRRNRIIAGLSDATVVVRAGAESGALVTARDAHHEGRPVFAIRGPPGELLSEGPERLLRAGVAREVTDAADLCVQLGWDVHIPTRAAPTAPQPPRVQTDEAGERLLAFLDDRTAKHVDDLAASAHLAPQEVLRKLTELELLGLCRQRPGKYFVRC